MPRSVTPAVLCLGAGLCRHYRVVRLDLRGHGASQVPPESSALDMDRLVADVSELLAHLGVKACHIVGNSAGGYIAQNLAMTSPEKVKSLMLFGSTAGLRNSQAASWLPRIAKEGLRGFFAATIADRCRSTRCRRASSTGSSTRRQERSRLDRALRRLMSRSNGATGCAEIKCPTLLVLPGGETVGSIRNYDVMIERIPDVQAITYEACRTTFAMRYRIAASPTCSPSCAGGSACRPDRGRSFAGVVNDGAMDQTIPRTIAPARPPR
jgi:pimeloyl-ACP methyl ester carboxylesterase